MGASAAIMQSVLIFLAFAILAYEHVVSDFTVENVVENSFAAMPLLYKITGVWGNHEGSMLLWVMILAFYGMLIAGLWQQPAARTQSPSSCGARYDRPGLPGLHPGNIGPRSPASSIRQPMARA